MKRSYLILAFLFAGTVASAHLIASAPGATASSMTAGGVKDKVRAQPVAAVSPPAAATMATGRPPVPLLLTSRPTIANAGAVEMASRDPAPVTAGAVGVDSKDTKTQEGLAKRAIELDGYKGVKGLAKGSDGVWRGRALRGSTEIAIGVDASGNVSVTFDDPPNSLPGVPHADPYRSRQEAR